MASSVKLPRFQETGGSATFDICGSKPDDELVRLRYGPVLFKEADLGPLLTVGGSGGGRFQSRELARLLRPPGATVSKDADSVRVEAFRAAHCTMSEHATYVSAEGVVRLVFLAHQGSASASGAGAPPAALAAARAVRQCVQNAPSASAPDLSLSSSPAEAVAGVLPPTKKRRVLSGPHTGRGSAVQNVNNALERFQKSARQLQFDSATHREHAASWCADAIAAKHENQAQTLKLVHEALDFAEVVATQKYMRVQEYHTKLGERPPSNNLQLLEEQPEPLPPEVLPEEEVNLATDGNMHIDTEEEEDDDGDDY